MGCSVPVKLEMRNYFLSYLDTCVTCPFSVVAAAFNLCQEYCSRSSRSNRPDL